MGNSGLWDRSNALPNTIRRYSRLKICATLQSPPHAKQILLSGTVFFDRLGTGRRRAGAVLWRAAKTEKFPKTRTQECLRYRVRLP